MISGMALACGALAPVSYLAAPFDWRAAVTPPPAPGSTAAAADRAAYLAAAPDSPGWRAAQTQLRLLTPEMNAQFSCAAGRRLSPETTPRTLAMLVKLTAETELSEAAKTQFKRDRPFVGEAKPVTCDPRVGGATPSFSYPSGHAMYGALAGRALAAAVPERAAALLALGAGIGTNRVACRVHYPSDIAAGQRLGDAVYDAVAATPGFKADLAAARAEIAAAPQATGCPAA
ncbi:phosphatase PAP2 family protein [Glacieibacterium frigidum]|nr:phosphatase PAP2 family protein [Glacieibacterium frigidum]